MTTRGYEIARWLMATLPSPGDVSADLRLTPDQIEFLADLYRLDGSRYVHRRASLSGAKGIGKSPLAAMIALAEFAGPYAPPAPLVQVAALSEEQANSTVYSMILELVRANDRRVASKLGIDDGRGRLFLHGRAGKLEAVTSAAGSHEGERTSFAILDECHLWTARNGGASLARTIRRNVSKSGGRTLELSNAPELGLGSVAEATEADVAAGKPGILFAARRPSRLPDPEMSDAELLALLDEVYGDAPWVDTSRMLAEVRDPSVPWGEAVRFYFNSPAGGSSVLVEPAHWDALASPGDIADGSRIALGYDGSYSQDGTALVAVTEDGRLSLELLVERDANDAPDWTVPRQLVNETVADVFARFDVVRLLADPYHWRDEIAAWAREYGEEIVLELPTNSIRRFGPAVDRFLAALAAGRLSHNGDHDLRRHVLNARLLRGRGSAADDGHALYTLEKPGPRRLIDAAVASVLAYEALATTAPPEPEREPMVAWR